MGWSIGYDDNWKRDIGYGVPSMCDKPGCEQEIHRGLDYVCGGEPYGGEHGCGLYFCGEHRGFFWPNHDEEDNEDAVCVSVCSRCEHAEQPFTPKQDVKEWVDWKLTHESWETWRNENSKEVEKMKGMA